METFYEILAEGQDADVSNNEIDALSRATERATEGLAVKIYQWTQTNSHASFVDLIHYFIEGANTPDFWRRKLFMNRLAMSALELKLHHRFPDESYRQERLGELVHEHKANEASSINNDGMNAQLQFLSEHYPNDEDLLKEFT